MSNAEDMGVLAPQMIEAKKAKLSPMPASPEPSNLADVWLGNTTAGGASIGLGMGEASDYSQAREQVRRHAISTV